MIIVSGYLTPGYRGKIFRLNRDAKGVKKGTLVEITIAGEYGCRLKEYPSGKALGGGFVYGWLDPADDV